MDNESQKPIDLKLDAQGQDHTFPDLAPGLQPASRNSPVIGWFAVGCGVLSLFVAAIIFVPLALIFSIIAMLLGQFTWALAGVMLAIIGFITSPQLLLLVGLGAFAVYFGL